MTEKEISELTFQEAGNIFKNGKMMELLKNIPMEQWKTMKLGRHSLLHFACRTNHVKDVQFLLTQGLDIESRSDNTYFRPVHFCVISNSYQSLEVLIAAGVDVHSTSRDGNSLWRPIDHGFGPPEYYEESMKVLVSNGVRLSTATRKERLTPYMVAFEQGVLRCRDVVIVLLGLKKRRQILGKLDRLLVQQVLAVEIWATRLDENEKWQK